MRLLLLLWMCVNNSHPVRTDVRAAICRTGVMAFATTDHHNLIHAHPIDTRIIVIATVVVGEHSCCIG